MRKQHLESFILHQDHYRDDKIDPPGSFVTHVPPFEGPTVNRLVVPPVAKPVASDMTAINWLPWAICNCEIEKRPCPLSIASAGIVIFFGVPKICIYVEHRTLWEEFYWQTGIRCRKYGAKPPEDCILAKISGYNDNLPLHEILRLSHCVGAPTEKLKASINGT